QLPLRGSAGAIHEGSGKQGHLPRALHDPPGFMYHETKQHDGNDAVFLAQTGAAASFRSRGAGPGLSEAFQRTREGPLRDHGIRQNLVPAQQ
ncbi:hypothetical protein NPIL_53101, partial [Nephila pilipes]